VTDPAACVLDSGPVSRWTPTGQQCRCLPVQHNHHQLGQLCWQSLDDAQALLQSLLIGHAQQESWEDRCALEIAASLGRPPSRSSAWP
jgi:hypothetical protein